MQLCFLCSLSTKNTWTSFATCHVRLPAGLSLFGCMEVQPLLWGLKQGDLVHAPPDNGAEDLHQQFAVVDWDVFWWLSGEDGTPKTSLVKSSKPCVLLLPLSVELDSTSDSAPKVVWCMVEEGIVPLTNKTHFAGVAGGRDSIPIRKISMGCGCTRLGFWDMICCIIMLSASSCMRQLYSMGVVSICIRQMTKQLTLDSKHSFCSAVVMNMVNSYIGLCSGLSPGVWHCEHG